MAEQHPSWDQIEPNAKGPRSGSTYRPDEHDIELSKAISLKRIADDSGVIRSLLSQIEMNTRNNTP